MTERLIARRWLIRGEVQGVGFRWSTARRAQGIGLAGWVKNLPDGRVEVVARGTAQQIEDLEAFLERGPKFSRVDNVEKASIPHEQIADNAFNIK